LGGNDLTAYINGKKLARIDIDGNAESIYYPLEKDSTMEMLNYTQSSYLSMWMDDEGKLEKLLLHPKPAGKTIPIPDLTNEEKTLKKFAWYGDIRPVDNNDIFRFYKKKVAPASVSPVETEPVLPTRDSSFVSDTVRLLKDAVPLKDSDNIDSLELTPVTDTIIGFLDESASGKDIRQHTLCKLGKKQLLYVTKPVRRRIPVSGKLCFFNKQAFIEQKNKQKRI
jgi:hypothetical protein